MAKGSGGGGETKDRNIYGTVGNDILGTRDRSITFGLQGNDTITGAAGADQVIGGDGNDIINTGDGFDFVIGGLGNDVMNGGLGIDTLSYENFDYLGVLNSGVGAISGVTVNLNISTAQNTSGAGFDTISSFEQIIGSQYNDVLTGLANQTSMIIGGAGNDRITGGSASDLLSGYEGNDTIDGGGGDDRIWGDLGNDTIRGSAGNDDITEQGAGNDFLDGGLGADGLRYDGLAAGIRVDLNILTAQNTGGGGIDTILNIEGVSGTQFADVLTGNALANVFSGGDGADVLTGMGGDDFLYGGGIGGDRLSGGDGNDYLEGGYDLVANGGNGNDTIFGTGTLTGGAGNDKITAGAGSFVGTTFVPKGSVVTGGTGADTFIFNANASYADVGITRITDFNRVEGDKIDLRGALQTFNPTGTPVEFIGSAAFSSFVGLEQVRVVNTGINSWQVQTDINGDRLADTVIEVTGSTTLVASDFILV